ncbi:acetyl/propionyl/methylcrotonyl-CoA carboxylase subunit alpha [Sphingomonas ursincola]|uniref:acetyl/propionyl/methylcrotonyl-CoA carboxylase subunit alpha n=1 Tax=Sphingomonas ursincola TaxID=56361 RepID=UPI002357873E|nr:acetyl/propionyl/methylcrotonyl-CoA carboxylase subunit alpha [Sphingomonas ursincola]MBY0621129.1 acetyl/propionyl/methylcrotonyl-CoA carboxylase subunit alpha [Sphingomonas ursincola]
MLKSLLIANRGEIACRIIRTARAMGIRTVAVYSDADARALHVRQADEAVHIGPSPARESYLVGEKIIAAAKATGAEAIHPGYGFLSENAEFAQAVIDAGLIWVGPKPDSIRAMGLKDAAKKLMDAAGVPTTPGYLGEDQSPERLAAEAERIGYPVLIKAVAGGGGKGMRKVDDASGFADALISCKREAAASFGNDVVLLEKWIESPRHIEVQVFGDSHGNVVHLFERDCSLQRRHQKVIEEAPAPGMDAATREAVCGAAVRAAKAVDYQGAGTIEFIADGSEGLRADRIWFMEMNTRLQVEHPVTEEITGVDLVEWQLRVASGEPLPKRQDELGIDGWAIEARIYAEDPTKGFLPSIGKLDRFDFHAWGGGVRFDTGVEQGSEITPFYDPMIAKAIMHAKTRELAIGKLSHILSETEIYPVKNNIGFVVALLGDEVFLNGEMTTGLISERGDSLIPDEAPSQRALEVAAFVLCQQGEEDSLPSYAGFRLNAPKRKTVMLDGGYGPRQVDIPDSWPNEVPAIRNGSEVMVTELGITHRIVVYEPRGTGHHSAHDGDILSPMPGKVIAVDVAAGQAVTKGQKLLTLEAMKMEHSLVAPFDGVVAELNASEGEQVQVEALLVRIEAAE